MNPTSSLLSLSPAKASTLVGLALVHSLLKHEDVLQNTQAKNAALDFLAMLRASSPAHRVLQQFYVLRRHGEPLAYLPLYKIRRWIETQVNVSVDGEPVGGVRLGFRSYAAMKRRYQCDAWEFTQDPARTEDSWVRFHWTTSVIEGSDGRRG